MEDKKGNHVMLIIYVALLVLTLILVLKFGVSPKEEAEKIGFITVGDVSNTGWSAINYEGVKNACEKLGVRLVERLAVPENDGSCLQAVKELAKEDVGMIILNSGGYSKELQQYLSDFPNIAFYDTNADYHAANLTTYSSRLYQARYLSGIVAGMQTKTGKIGFVAADKRTDVYRGLNAFALGVRRVNPDAEVIVAWTEGMTDEEGGIHMAQKLIGQENVDVITYHQNQPYVIAVAEQSGIASIGYYEPMEGVSDKYLTCAMCDWEPLYENLIQEYLRGQANTLEHDWMGLETGVITLTEYSPLVSEETKAEVEEATQEILSGLDVFSGTIYDNQGKERCAVGETMSDKALIYDMNWLVEGVRVYEE